MTEKPTNRNPNHGIQTVRWAEHRSRQRNPVLKVEHRRRIAAALRALRRLFGRPANWPKVARSSYRFACTYAGVRHTACPYLLRLEQAAKVMPA